MSLSLRLMASAAALALAATPASATTILISFAGTNIAASGDDITNGTLSVSGSILIDTAALPENVGAGYDFNYATQDQPFLTTTVTYSGGTGPAFGGTVSIINLLRGSFGANGFYELTDQRYAQFDSAGSQNSELSLVFNGDTARQTIDGRLLPTFAVGQTLSFSAQSSSNRFDPDPTDARNASAQGDVRVTAVTVSGAPTTPAVPEPATWATLTLGFGLAGAALRRRRPAFA